MRFTVGKAYLIWLLRLGMHRNDLAIASPVGSTTTKQLANAFNWRWHWGTLAMENTAPNRGPDCNFPKHKCAAAILLQSFCHCKGGLCCLQAYNDDAHGCHLGAASRCCLCKDSGKRENNLRTSHAPGVQVHPSKHIRHRKARSVQSERHRNALLEFLRHLLVHLERKACTTHSLPKRQ
jgi:hypothetical protein